ENASALLQVCQRLDGIPLAIELAAARVRALSIHEINARMTDRFQLLRSQTRTVTPKQQTLRATIEWSYALLSEKETLLYSRLSVFVDGCSLEAAEHICSGTGIDQAEVVDLLAQLVDKSLVFTTDRTGTMRYRMLETIREYGRGKLV